MIPKLNVVSVLAALVFFFLPWVSIECGGSRMGAQNGFQTIVGVGSPSSEAAAKNAPARGGGRSSGNSYLVAFALIAVISAAAMAWAALLSDREDLSDAVGMLCATALACLVAQAILGFPVKREVMKATRTANDPAAVGAGSFGELEKMLSNELAGRIEIKMTPWFFLELSALGIPSVLLMSTLAGRLRGPREVGRL
jgi:hypothetical protein